MARPFAAASPDRRRRHQRPTATAIAKASVARRRCRQSPPAELPDREIAGLGPACNASTNLQASEWRLQELRMSAVPFLEAKKSRAFTQQISASLTHSRPPGARGTAVAFAPQPFRRQDSSPNILTPNRRTLKRPTFRIDYRAAEHDGLMLGRIVRSPLRTISC